MFRICFDFHEFVLIFTGTGKSLEKTFEKFRKKISGWKVVISDNWSQVNIWAHLVLFSVIKVRFTYSTKPFHVLKNFLLLAHQYFRLWNRVPYTNSLLPLRKCHRNRTKIENIHSNQYEFKVNKHRKQFWFPIQFDISIFALA